MNRSWLAYAGLAMNIICAVLTVAFVLNAHGQWNEIPTDPSVRVGHTDKLLRILCFQMLPSLAGAMSASAVLFWVIRK